MPCSAITLSLATICSVASVALLAIAFGTDNWQYIEVKRSFLDPQRYDEFNAKAIFYTRTKGLFRICYPDKHPEYSEEDRIYVSPVETNCENIDYHIFEQDTSSIEGEEMARLHMARSMVAMFIISFFFFFVAFWTGVAGCWRRSPGNVASTAILMLLACLFAAGGMGLWHGVEYYEEEKLTTDPYRMSWDEQLQKHSHTSYGWSYFIAWIGVAWAFIAALLFSGASVCLKNEREKEDVKNLAYLMPVYPQKHQYPSYGYAYPGSYHYGAHAQYAGNHYNY